MISNLKDILDCHETSIKARYGDNLDALILYGSFAYDRDLIHTNTKQFDTLQDLHDKKPDFIVVVKDLSIELHKMAEKYDWIKLRTSFLQNFMKKTPCYFNLKTEKDYRTELSKITIAAPLPYKVGLTDTTSLSDFGYNLYLAGRLSKFTQNLYKSPDSNIETAIKNIQNRFADIALSLLPENITGEDFVTKYLQASYLSESARRIFDNQKHLEILNCKVYDLAREELVPMRKELEGILADLIVKKTVIQEIKTNMYDSVFMNPYVGLKLIPFTDITVNNIYASFSILKCAVSNSSVKGDNLSYLKRKWGV